MSVSAPEEPCGFEAIWNLIKGWDIGRHYPAGESSGVTFHGGLGYAGATGDDVRAIINALNDAGLQILPKMDSRWCCDCGVHHQPGRHVRRDAPGARSEMVALTPEAIESIIRPIIDHCVMATLVTADKWQSMNRIHLGDEVQMGNRIVSGSFRGIDGNTYVFGPNGMEVLGRKDDTSTEVNWHEPGTKT